MGGKRERNQFDNIRPKLLQRFINDFALSDQVPRTLTSTRYTTNHFSVINNFQLSVCRTRSQNEVTLPHTLVDQQPDNKTSPSRITHSTKIVDTNFSACVADEIDEIILTMKSRYLDVTLSPTSTYYYHR